MHPFDFKVILSIHSQLTKLHKSRADFRCSATFPIFRITLVRVYVIVLYSADFSLPVCYFFRESTSHARAPGIGFQRWKVEQYSKSRSRPDLLGPRWPTRTTSWGPPVEGEEWTKQYPWETCGTTTATAQDVKSTHTHSHILSERGINPIPKTASQN